jgi:hypothetical protein
MIIYDDNYLTYDDKWVVNLAKVEFITMKQNWENNNFHIKLHIGSKEVRMELDSNSTVDELIKRWKQTR